jgi:hypothetical protein
MKFWIWLAAAALVAGCGDRTNNQGGEGDEGPKGGDVVAQEAAGIVSDVVTQVSAMPEVFPEVDLNKLSAAASRVHIIVRQKTYANGVETDATNNGYDTISLNISRWLNLTSYEQRLALLCHELFGLIGVEQSANYSVSRKIRVEGRFDSNRLFTCWGHSDMTGGPVKCTLRLSFDGSQHAFSISDLNCDYPGIDAFPPHSAFNRVTEKEYSTNVSCSPNTTPGETICSARPGSGKEYDSLSFGVGYTFRFSGLMNSSGTGNIRCDPN